MQPRSTPPEAGALTARGRATRNRILASAADLMHQRGVAHTTLDDVRAATDTSKSQLYHYFADKSALVCAVIGHQLIQMMQAQRLTTDPPESVDALRRWRDRVVSLNRRTATLGGCPLGRLAGEVADHDPAARVALANAFATWQQHLGAGLTTMRSRGDLAAHADPEALAQVLLSAAEGGLLLAQATRSTQALERALDHAIQNVEALALPETDNDRSRTGER